MEHREQRDTRRNRQDDSPYILTDTITMDWIKSCNARHDREYGWTGQNFYSNPARLPESYFGSIEKVWDHPESALPVARP
jgi:hypothetical protein